MSTEETSAPDDLAASLRGVGPDQYGPSYGDHALEMHKTYLDMADRVSGRREKANSFFLAVNTALIAVLAKDAIITDGTPSDSIELLLTAAGVANCYLWYRIVRSYRDLNSAKFKVVHEIEKQLPLRPYTAEWESVGRGKNRRLYLPFTHVEILVPWLFIALLIIFAGTTIDWVAVCQFWCNAS